MRVLIIAHGHPSYSIGGAEVAAQSLFSGINSTADNEAFYLARAPAQVGRRTQTPFMSLNHGPRETFYHPGEWDEFWLSNGGVIDLDDSFASYLRLLNPDIIHFHHIIGLGVEALALARRVMPHAKIVFTFHEYLAICHNHGQMIKTNSRKLCANSSAADCSVCFPAYSPADFAVRKEHIQAHLSLADAFVSPSQFLVERFSDWGLSRGRFTVIENGVRGTAIAPRAIRVGGRRDRFAYFGQISEFKGLHVLIDAINLIQDDVWLDASLSIYGGNLERQPVEFQNSFKRSVEAAGRKVRFYGSYNQDELPTLMSDADWVVVPSIWWENSPVVIQEASLHKRPMIVSNIGGMIEKVRDGVNGLVFRAGSSQSLADVISKSLCQNHLWAELSNGAEKTSCPREFAGAHLELYNSLFYPGFAA